MPEAVIVATARSPIGRAFKGSLTSIRPDDLLAQMVRGRAGEGTATRSGRHRRPDRSAAGCQAASRDSTWRAWSRCCSARQPARHHGQPLLLVVAADHPDGLPRDQGGRGRRVHLRRRRVRVPLREGDERLPARHPEPAVRRRCGPHAATAEASAADWHDPRSDGEIPDVYIAMGQTAENVAAARGITRLEQDEFGVRSQNLAEKALADGFWQREITPVTLPDGDGRVRRRRAAAGDDAGEDRRAQAGVPRARHGDRGELLPAERRRGGPDRDERRQGGRARDNAARPDRRYRGQRALAGDHGPRAGGGVPAGAAAGRDGDLRRRPRGDQRGVRGAGHPVATGISASTWRG